MSDSPFFQFYPSDWLAGTRGLTAAETGVYITLVAMMYEAEGPIPNDAKRLARLCGSTPAALKKSIHGLIEAGKITEDERGFFNRRVEIEIEKRAEKRAAASASANARWKKAEQKQQPKNANASKTQCERNANQKPEPEKRKTEAKASAKKRSQLPDDWRLPREWGEWALAKGMDELSVRREAEQFANHHQSRATLMADWRKAWQTWVNNNIKWKAERSTPAAKAGVPQIGEVREYSNGIRKQYAGNGVGWVVLHA